MRKDTAETYWRAVFALTLAVAFIVLAVPFRPEVIRGDLDSSWIQSLHAAYDQHLRYGSQFVFTYGPLGFVRAPVFWPGHYGFTLAFWAVISAGVVACCASLARESRALPLGLLAGVFFGLAMGSLWARDAIVLTLELAFVWRVAVRGVLQPMDLALLVVMGLLGLTKLTYGVVAAMAVVVVSSILAIEGRLRLAVLAPGIALAAFLAGWVGIGQRIADLPAFLRTAVQIVLGYDDAMSLPGDVHEAAVYCVLAILVALAWLWDAWSVKRPSHALAVLFSIATVFVTFRYGFTRHDGHAAMPFAYLPAAIAMVTLGRGDNRARWTNVANAFLLLCAVACAFWSLFIHFSYSPTRAVWAVGSRIGEEVGSIPDFATGQREALARFRAAQSEIKRASPLPPLEGTVDIYSYGQAYLFAHHLAWKPRPVLQSYSAYTASLAAMDASFVSNPDAPDHILFSIQPIDGHWPALEDGASWLPIIEHYTLRESGRWLVLDRVDGSPPLPRVAVGERAGIDWIEIPAGMPMVLASIEVERPAGSWIPPTLGGPMLWIELRLANHKIRRFRFFAGGAREPVLVSPLVESTQDFAALVSRRPMDLKPHAVQAVRIVDRAGNPVRATLRITGVR